MLFDLDDETYAGGTTYLNNKAKKNTLNSSQRTTQTWLVTFAQYLVLEFKFAHMKHLHNLLDILI